MLLVSGVQKSDPVIHVFILFQIPFSFRLLQSTVSRVPCAI